MRKKILIILFSFMIIVCGGYVEAASFKMTASTTQVNPNGTFSISVGGDCIGRVNLSVTNGTISKSSVWVEQNYQTVTIKAGSSGTVTVTATPVAGFSDSDANEYKPGSRSVKVTIVKNESTGSEKPNTQPPATQPNNSGSSNTKPSNNQPSTTKPSTTNQSNSGKPNTKPSTNQPNNSEKNQQTEIEEKSSNNLLSSINTNIGTLEPNFDTNISEYSIKLPGDAQTITINAVSQDGKAVINGVGETKLELGENIIVITVVAENGEEKKYTIKAYVDETPQVYLKYKDKEIGIVRNLKDAPIPEGFNKKEHMVNDYSINIFNNEYFSIVYGIDSEGNKDFYIIDTEKNECMSKIMPMTIDKHSFYLVDIDKERTGFEISSIKVGDREIVGYKFKKGFIDYFLLSVMNNKGELTDYLYETKEGTLQLYSGSAPIDYSQYEDLIKEMNTKQMIIYVLSIFLLLSFIVLVILSFKLRKEKLNEKEH